MCQKHYVMTLHRLIFEKHYVMASHRFKALSNFDQYLDENKIQQARGIVPMLD